MALKGLSKESEVRDDFAVYTDATFYPKWAEGEELVVWFDRVFGNWYEGPGMFTSCGLDMAIRKLSERGWSFVLTLSQSERLAGVPDTERKPFDGSIISWFDVSAQGKGYATKDAPYFVGVSQDYLTFSKRGEGLVKAFAPKDECG
jgi:hypothetical protein